MDFLVSSSVLERGLIQKNAYYPNTCRSVRIHKHLAFLVGPNPGQFKLTVYLSLNKKKMENNNKKTNTYSRALPFKQA